MENESPSSSEDKGRRGFLGHASTLTIAGGLAAGNGMLANHATRFLYPANVGERGWQFVYTLSELAVEDVLPLKTQGLHCLPMQTCIRQDVQLLPGLIANFDPFREFE